MTYEQIQDHLRDVERALAALCESGGDRVLAHRAYLAVIALGQLLVDADSDDERVSATLAHTRRAVGRLLDALARLVGPEDRELAVALFEPDVLAVAGERRVTF